MARATASSLATTGPVQVDKTPVTVPADLTALETAVPAAGQPAGENWRALYGTAPDYQIATVFGGAWVGADQDPGAANPTSFLDNTTVAPATAGQPTEAEIATAAGATRDSFLEYTGTDTATDAPTHVYYIDSAGAVTTLLSPAAAAGAFTGSSAGAAGAGGSVPPPAAGTQDLTLHGDGLWRQTIPNWTANTDYSQGALVYQSSGIHRRVAVGTSGLVFDATEEAAWLRIADDTVVAGTLRLATETETGAAALTPTATAYIGTALLPADDAFDGNTGTNVTLGAATIPEQVTATFDATNRVITGFLVQGDNIDHDGRLGLRVLTDDRVVHAQTITGAIPVGVGPSAVTVILTTPIYDIDTVAVEFTAEPPTNPATLQVTSITPVGDRELARLVWEQADGTYVDHTGTPTVIAGTETILPSLGSPPAVTWDGAWTPSETAGVVVYRPETRWHSEVGEGIFPSFETTAEENFFFQISPGNPDNVAVYALMGGRWTSIGPDRYRGPVANATDAYTFYEWDTLQDGTMVWARDLQSLVMFDRAATTGLAEPPGKPNPGVDSGWWRTVGGATTSGNPYQEVLDAAARAAVTGQIEGDVVKETSTGDVYKWDGTDWRLIGKTIISDPNWQPATTYAAGDTVLSAVPVGTATAGTPGEIARWGRIAAGTSDAGGAAGAMPVAEETAWTYLGAAVDTYAALSDVDMAGIQDGDSVYWDAANSRWVPGRAERFWGFVPDFTTVLGLPATVGDEVHVGGTTNKTYKLVGDGVTVDPTNGSHWRLTGETTNPTTWDATTATHDSTGFTWDVA